MKRIIPLVFSLLLFIFPKSVRAVEDPLKTPNNRFGIHILDENDLDNASTLVNSSGGNWGYVTLVIRKDERDIKRWQKVFDQMRRLHLTPIVRIATQQQNNGWEKFTEDDIDNWVYFLNSLNWVIKNRYVIVGNEVNHADEWGGEINPPEYAATLCSFYQRLKQASDGFFVIHAGLDASAPNDKVHMDEEKFIKEEYRSNTNVLSCFDGWSSHSYPNPNFTGSEYASGRGSVKTYLWEQEILKNLGFKSKTPIFITETGWAVNLNGKKSKYSNPKTLSGKYKYAFEKVWKDDNIVAITPFVLSYSTPPFDIFSWKKTDGSFFPFFDEVKNIKKTKGVPIQEEKGEIKHAIIPKISISGSVSRSTVLVSNEGQSIWYKETTKVVLELENKATYESAVSTPIEPGKTGVVSVRLNIPENIDFTRGRIYLVANNKQISTDYKFEILTIRPISQKENLFTYLKNTIEAWVTRRQRGE